MNSAPDPYRLIVEHFPDGGVFLYEEHEEGHLVYTFVEGDVLAEIGLTKEDLEGAPVADGRPDAIREKMLSHYRRALAGERVTLDLDAEGKHYHIRLLPVPDETGTVTRGLGIAQDVTEQVAYREELLRQNRRLEQFTQLVFHDIRGPLNVAQGRLELLRDECDSAHIDPIERALDRIESLTADRTAVGAARTDDELSPVSLRTAAQSAWSNVATQSATLVVETNQSVRADEGDLRRAFENLFRNAVTHGGSAVTVTVGSLATGFFVEDDGVGIPSDERDVVLNQGVSHSDSTGLGLFIVTGIADGYGWTVQVTESESGGARFEFRDVGLVSE